MIREKVAVCDAQSRVSMGCRWLGSLCVIVALVLLVPGVVNAQTNGGEMEQIAALQEKIRELENQVNDNLIPRDAVAAFELDECPAGWEEYELAYGRFIRGIDRNPSDERIDPDGERIAGTLQDDNVGEHVHIYQGGGADRASTADNDCCDIRETWSGGDWRQQNGRETIQNPTGETRPNNVALLYCIKN